MVGLIILLGLFVLFLLLIGLFATLYENWIESEYEGE